MNPYLNLDLFLPFIGAITGMAIAIIARPKTPSGFKLILAFSGAFLLGINLFHLMPSVFNAPNFEAGVWIMGGVLLQIILENTSRGVEHGHHYNNKSRIPFLYLFGLAFAFMPLSKACH